MQATRQLAMQGTTPPDLGATTQVLVCRSPFPQPSLAPGLRVKFTALLVCMGKEYAWEGNSGEGQGNVLTHHDVRRSFQ